MSDWNDADDLATAVAVLGAAGILLSMTLNVGHVSTEQMITWAIDVIYQVAVPSFSLILFFYFLLKLEPLIEALTDL